MRFLLNNNGIIVDLEKPTITIIQFTGYKASTFDEIISLNPQLYRRHLYDYFLYDAHKLQPPSLLFVSCLGEQIYCVYGDKHPVFTGTNILCVWEQTSCLSEEKIPVCTVGGQAKCDALH